MGLSWEISARGLSAGRAGTTLRTRPMTVVSRGAQVCGRRESPPREYVRETEPVQILDSDGAPARRQGLGDDGALLTHGIERFPPVLL